MSDDVLNYDSISKIKIKFISFESENISLVVTFSTIYEGELIESQPLAYNLHNFISGHHEDWAISWNYETSLKQIDIIKAKLAMAGQTVLQDIIKRRTFSKRNELIDEIQNLVDTEFETNLDDYDYFVYNS